MSKRSCFCYTGFITFMPGYLNAAMGLTIEKGTLVAGAIMTVLYLIASLGQFWGGSRVNTGLLEKYWLMMLVIILPFFVLLWLGGTWLALVILSGLAFPFVFFRNAADIKQHPRQIQLLSLAGPHPEHRIFLLLWSRLLCRHDWKTVGSTR